MRKVMDRARLLPFLVAGMYIPYMGLSFCGDEVWYLANELLFVSPAACLMVWWIGRPFKFCGWWKMQCFIPCVPTLAAIIQHYIGFRAGVALSAIIILLIGSIINGVKVYFTFRVTSVPVQDKENN